MSICTLIKYKYDMYTYDFIYGITSPVICTVASFPFEAEETQDTKGDPPACHCLGLGGMKLT